MGIGNDELDATQTAPGQAAQEVRLKRLSFEKTRGHAKNFAHGPPIWGVVGREKMRILIEYGLQISISAVL